MRTTHAWFVVMVVGCGRNAPEPAPMSKGSAAGSATNPLVLIDGKEATAAAAKVALARAGMRVRIANEIDSAMWSGLFFGAVDAPPDKAMPPAAARMWRSAGEQCRPLKAQCPDLTLSAPGCEALLRCTQGALPAIRERWIRELGAVAWIHVVAGPTESRSGSKGFFGKAWGHRVCEPNLRELRAGAETEMMMVGEDAPVPASEASAQETAGALAVRIARGEGEVTERPLTPHAERPSEAEGLIKLLGCD
jgi:hypothetical protein